MRYSHQKYLRGQTPFGVFTNLWPTELCRRDRETLARGTNERGWYLHLHIGSHRFCWEG